MAGRDFTVTPAMLAEKAEELDGQKQNLVKQIDKLIDQEKSLDNMWDGPANEAFKQTFATKTQELVDFVSTMETYITTLNQIASDYAQAEKVNLTTAKG